MQLGVDLGGTKIEAIVLDEKGEALWRKRVPTPKDNYECTLASIVQLVTEGKQASGLDHNAAIGMGTPGAETKQGVMKNCNSTALNGRSLRADLSQLLNCPIRLANDANCFALAETLSGQGKQYFGEGLPETVFGVILGTGVGGGIIVNGKLLIGANAIAGEWGHNPLPMAGEPDARDCYCGRENCVETFLSGPGLALSYRLYCGEVLAPEQIIEKMRKGHPKAVSVWQQYLQQLALGLAQVVNVLDPSLIVLGGGLSSVPEIYQEIVPKMQPYVFSDTFDTPVLPALLGDSAGVYGAAWLAK